MPAATPPPARARPGHAGAPFLLVAVLACASAGPAPSGARTPDGIYDFIGRTGENAELRGTLTIAGGDLLLAPEQGICRVDATSINPEKTRFLCDHVSDIENLALVIDRRVPTMRSSWTGSVRQRRQRTICVQYAVQNGRQVCVRTQTETYEVRVGVSGPLTFNRRPPGASPAA